MSQMTEPPFSAPSTGWTEEMEAAARRPRPLAPPPRRWRVALRVSAWSAGFALVLATIGTLLFIHRGDAEGSQDWISPARQLAACVGRFVRKS